MSYYYSKSFGVSLGMERGLRTSEVIHALVSSFDLLTGSRGKSIKNRRISFMDVAVLWPL